MSLTASLVCMQLTTQWTLRQSAHLGTPVPGCTQWDCLWFGGWATPLPHPLPPQLPPAPHGGCTGRKRGWNGDRNPQGGYSSPRYCSPRLGPAGHSLTCSWERPTPWPFALTKRGSEEWWWVEWSDEREQEGTGRVPEAACGVHRQVLSPRVPGQSGCCIK